MMFLATHSLSAPIRLERLSSHPLWHASQLAIIAMYVEASITTQLAVYVASMEILAPLKRPTPQISQLLLTSTIITFRSVGLSDRTVLIAEKLDKRSKNSCHILVYNNVKLVIWSKSEYNIVGGNSRMKLSSSNPEES